MQQAGRMIIILKALLNHLVIAGETQQVNKAVGLVFPKLATMFLSSAKLIRSNNGLERAGK